MADTDKLVEQLSGLSVLEIAGLVKQLEEKWGVSAAAPVAVERKTLCAQGTVVPTTLTCDAPGCADCVQDNKAASSQVAVTYQTTMMVNVPGILTNQLTLTRIAEARIIAE